MLYRKLIEQHLENKETIFQDDQHQLRYFELNEYAKAFYRILKNLPRDGTILICSINCIESCIVMLGCIAFGYRYTVVHEKITDDKKMYILQNSKISLVVGKNPDWCVNSNRDILFFPLKDIWKLEKIDSDYQRQLIPLSQDVYILYTSGTTRLPKGVLAGVSQVIFSIDAINKVLLNSKEDFIWNCLPLAFDYGMYQLFLALDSEASFYISSQPVISCIPKILVQKKITAFPVVPSLLGMLLKSKLLSRIEGLSLRYISSTGDALPVSWIKQIESLFPQTTVVPMYGITECKRVAIMPLTDKRKKYEGSCGLPIPGIEVEIEKQEEDDNFGELIVYGPNVMKGYWNSCVDGNMEFGFDKKRNLSFLKTGDIFQKDEDGYLYFIERKSAFIKSNGYRISGKEIDEYIFNHVIGVDEVYTLGVPDEILGQKIVTIISGKYVKKELKQAIMKLPHYMRPHKIKSVCYVLPKTDNGKYDKNKLYEIAVMM